MRQPGRTVCIRKYHVPNVRKITNPDQPPLEQQSALPLDTPPAEPKKRGRKTGADGNARGTRDGTGASLGFESTLWAAADKLRNNVDPAEYKHVVLGLIFLKYISDAFEERNRRLPVHGVHPDHGDRLPVTFVTPYS
jgi:HsdM N-terminal domain